MKQIAVYGAKSLALGVYRAMKCLYPEYAYIGFIVSSRKGNPYTLAEAKVWELKELKDALGWEERKNIRILVAVPEDIHMEIAECLIKNGFTNYICMDWQKEAELMGNYFAQRGIFPSIYCLAAGEEAANLCVYQARSYKDKRLKTEYIQPVWVVPVQAGSGLAGSLKQAAGLRDNTGKNISVKNTNYCELTVLYWMWKNILEDSRKTKDVEYYGLCHYRRVPDIREEDLKRLKRNDVDAVLPYPTLHEPDISEHHARYIKETDWQAMLQAIKELRPEYMGSFWEIFSQSYFYNYNMVIAKRDVLADYCRWLFPILERTEELCEPKGWERADRYIGYIGESLMTLYFLYHRKDLRIYHAGRRMLT